jgi:hypothetical protein
VKHYTSPVGYADILSRKGRGRGQFWKSTEFQPLVILALVARTQTCFAGGKVRTVFWAQSRR